MSARRGAGGERGNTRHDLDPEARGEAGEKIHERAVEERIALAQDSDISARFGLAADLACRMIVDLLGRKTLGHHGDPNGDLALPAPEELRDDRAREAVAVERRRIGDNRGSP